MVGATPCIRNWRDSTITCLGGQCIVRRSGGKLNPSGVVGSRRSKQKENQMTNAIQFGLAILRRRQVEARTGLSRSTIYQRIKEGTFPAQVSLGAKAVGWIESDINDWLARQIEQSRKAA